MAGLNALTPIKRNRPLPSSGYLEARLALGEVLLATGRLQEALAQYEAVLRMAPESEEAHIGRDAAAARLKRR